METKTVQEKNQNLKATFKQVIALRNLGLECDVNETVLSASVKIDTEIKRRKECELKLQNIISTVKEIPVSNLAKITYKLHGKGSRKYGEMVNEIQDVNQATELCKLAREQGFNIDVYMKLS